MLVAPARTMMRLIRRGGGGGRGGDQGQWGSRTALNHGREAQKRKYTFALRLGLGLAGDVVELLLLLSNGRRHFLLQHRQGEGRTLDRQHAGAVDRFLPFFLALFVLVVIIGARDAQSQTAHCR